MRNIRSSKEMNLILPAPSGEVLHGNTIGADPIIMASRKASMGMVDIRILGNIQVPKRQLHPHHNNHFRSNILYIPKHRQYSHPNHIEQTRAVSSWRNHIRKSTAGRVLRFRVLAVAIGS
jgi:hypothetical protein